MKTIGTRADCPDCGHSVQREPVDFVRADALAGIAARVRADQLKRKPATTPISRGNGNLRQ